MSTPEPTVIRAQTFTPMYSQTEDRIRLVINYADYANRVDLWLTRAFLLKLIPSIDDCLDGYETTAPSSEVQKQTDKTAQTQTDAPTLTMTEKQGYLVHAVDITHHKESQQFSLLFKTEQPQVRATLTAPLLRTVLKSIFAAIPKIEWGISPQWIR
ncbi:MAG: hypothetical protein PHW64_04915 [Sulfuricurvum sp.]|nr:hypothetical protein [Sulfuricurvum sp.]